MKNYLVIAALLMTSVYTEEVTAPSSEQPDAIADKHGSDDNSGEEEEDDKDADDDEGDEEKDDKDLDENDDDIDADELEKEHDHHEEDENMAYYFRYGVKNISHDDKLEDKHPGEDAWLAQSDLLMVADGVGGWEEHGIDSSKFSQNLVWDIRQEFESNKNQTLKDLMAKGSEASKHEGSSTLVMAKWDHEKPHILKTSNLGDSGYVLYECYHDGRKDKVKKVFRSQEQQHEWNMPF